MPMNIRDVHEHIKRAMDTTNKIANGAIAFHQARIADLEALKRSAQKVAADLVMPGSMAEADMHTALNVPGDLENEAVTTAAGGQAAIAAPAAAPHPSSGSASGSVVERSVTDRLRR